MGQNQESFSHWLKIALTAKFLEVGRAVWKVSLQSAVFFPRPVLLAAVGGKIPDLSLIWCGHSCVFWSRAFFVLHFSSQSCRLGVPPSLFSKTDMSQVGNQKFLLS